MYAVCRHCKQYRHRERRGLCRPCARDSSLGALYPRANAPKPVPKLCRHCNRNKAQYGRRGLCFGCSQKPEVRVLHSMAAKRHGGDNPAPKTPARATNAPPGSWLKLKVMCERADRGEALNHPGDCRTLHGVGAAELLPRGQEKGRAAG